MNPYQAPIKVFASPGSEILANEICRFLGPKISRANIPYDDGKLRLGEVKIDFFSNQNPQAQVEDVRGKFVVVINTQAMPLPLRFLELITMLHAIVNADPADILLVEPYMMFSRSDRKNNPRISVMALCFADIICSTFHIERVLLLDPHDTHIKHYFRPTADEISATYLFIDWLKKNPFSEPGSKKGWVVVYADAGAAKKYRQFSYSLGLPSAYIDKDRPDDSERPRNERIVGDVVGRFCLVVDDEILSGSTAINDANDLITAGAKKVFMVAIHPVLEDKHLSHEELIRKLEQSQIEKFIISDSIPVRHKLNQENLKFTVISICPFLAESIARIYYGNSLTDLHRPESVEIYRSF